MVDGTTAKSLIERAYYEADMEGSTFPDRSKVLADINDALAELHELLTTEDYFHSTEPITLVAGTEAYALPADFYKPVMVWKNSSGRRYEVPRFTYADLSGYSTTGPAASGTVELWYAPQLKRLKKDSDRVTVALPNQWDSFASVHAAVKMLMREESDSSALQAERNRLLQRIMANVEPRDNSMPGQIEDAYCRWGYGMMAPEERTLRYRIMGNYIHLVEFDYIGA